MKFKDILQILSDKAKVRVMYGNRQVRTSGTVLYFISTELYLDEIVRKLGFNIKENSFEVYFEQKK